MIPSADPAIDAAEASDRNVSFRELALPHLPAVLRVAYALVRDPSDADDLVQETFLRAHRYWSTFDRATDCKRWLATICRNAFRESYRHDQRTEVVEDHELESIAAARLHNRIRDSGLGDMFVRLDLRPAIERAIGRLDDHYRHVVLLADVEGFSYEEISETLNVPIGTVRSRLYRARRLLQEELFVFAVDAGYRSAVSKEGE